MQLTKIGIFSRVSLALALSMGVALATIGAASAANANVQFSGKVTAYTPAAGATNGTISLTNHAGASATYSVASSITLTEIGGSGDTLSIGDHATVVAAKVTPTVATSISFTASKPIRFSGRVTSYTAAAGATPGSISVHKRNGATLTYSTAASTIITESGGTGDTIVIRDRVTVVAQASAPTVATSITFEPAPPVKFSGKVTAYTPAVGSTDGSITLLNRPHAALTYSVTSATTITETGGTGDTLAVGDHATVSAAASAKTVAVAIAFNPPPAGTFSGYVTAYVPATTSTPGSVSLEKLNDTTSTFSTTTSTTISEIGGAGAILTVGDHATVTTVTATPTTASSITFTPEPPTVKFTGWITAYTAASGTTDGSISVRKRSGAMLTYSTKLSTTITEVGGTGGSPAVGDHVTVRASVSAKTVATSIKFSPAPPISFAGKVTAYTAATSTTAGSVTVMNHAGAILTFATTLSTTITESGGSGDNLAVADQVTVTAAASAKTIATAIMFTPAAPLTFAGKVTAYTAATGSTAGSITITDAASATLTYSTTSTTVITQAGGTGGTLAVGEHATVTALAATPTVAETITFTSS
jgi:hypothetical protein